MEEAIERWSDVRHSTVRFNYETIGLAVTTARSNDNMAISLSHLEQGLIAFVNSQPPFTPLLKPVGKKNIYALAYSPDGHLLATGGKDSFLRLIDVDEGREIRNHKAHWNFFVDAVVFSPNGDVLYYGVGNNNVRVWDYRDWKQLGKIQVSVGVVNTLAVSPDGQLLAVAGGNGIVRLLNSETGNQVAELRGHTHPLVGIRSGVRRVVFSADGRLLASSGSDKTVRLWDVSSGRNLQIMQHDGGVWGVDFPPNGRLLVSGGDDRTVRLWDVANGKQVGIMKFGNAIMGVAFLNENTICVACKDKNAYILSPS